MRRTATRGKEEEDKRRKEGRKNLLTADFSTSDDRGWGVGFSFVFLQRWHRKPKLWSGEGERGGGGERRRDKREQEVDGKVIAVSTWSVA